MAPKKSVETCFKVDLLQKHLFWPKIFFFSKIRLFQLNVDLFRLSIDKSTVLYRQQQPTVCYSSEKHWILKLIIFLIETMKKTDFVKKTHRHPFFLQAGLKILLLRNIFLKNPRGWLRWFFLLMLNLLVESFFHLENPEISAD